MASKLIVVGEQSPLRSPQGSEHNRLLNEVAGATDATREAGGRSCRGVERL